MDSDLTKEAIALPSISPTDSGEYQFLAVEGKAILMNRFAPSALQQTYSSQESSRANNTLLIGAVIIFGLGAACGVWIQSGQDAGKIERLTAENLILEAKLSKIRDLVR